MKITGIRTFLMHVGQPDPSNWAADQRSGDRTSKQFGGTRNWLFLKIDTDEGITGIGECSGWPRVVETAIHDLAPLLIGEDPAHIERCGKRCISR